MSSVERSPFQRHVELMTPRQTISQLVAGRNAVGIQVDRLLQHARRYAKEGWDNTDGRPVHEVDIDARFMVVALHQLWLALNWRRDERSRWWPPAEITTIERVVGRFRRDLTSDSTARDVVMHFDDYARGRGGPRASGRTRTAYVGASLMASPNDPMLWDAEVSVRVVGVTATGYEVVSEQHFGARMVGTWVETNVDALIVRLVGVERGYTYRPDGTVDSSGGA